MWPSKQSGTPNTPFAMTSEIKPVEVVALLSDGFRHKGLLDLDSGIFVYPDYKAGRAVTVKPYTTGKGGKCWTSCLDPGTDAVVAYSEHYSS